MIAMLCWIVGCYGMAVAAVHLAHGWQKLMRGSRPAPWMHVVIVSENDERHIEWMVRAFGFYTWLRGRQLHMTLLDCGSTDATLAIAERAVRGAGISWNADVVSPEEVERVLDKLESSQPAEAALVVVRLNRAEDLRKVPFMSGSAI
ncbi:glycosyltransferase [Paenibacillus thiaminolyticus]|uniref:Glycosyltransferase n=1 Tax=Paenibacillus thiaminolyticus TaxID=49283 RepID=A0AAP9J1N2_PANTH|nr:glycosyltransferase [Paenibacillus thiaminolyticus]MCY9538210.1 glycosyltransferase [Paenibacillus thiaminolyticus]MCY9602804.1 glycosyltransferase [Paenibacillus thiaminolyticus]MCY9610789.1 glycosyltransferase [Paenibacillus thiaminolyticus]MCY9615059.1 glycosyltransferase [Paenibacillus thiaminolyticus]MCY9621326.1 glycosyltransferase [Paenibacillus thiaminolyticus]